MNDFISNYTPGFGAQTTHAQQTGVTVAQQPMSTTQSNIAQAIISELRPGDVFQGEIISVGGEEVQLALLNGQYLTARLEGQVQLAIGQLLNFQVQSNDNTKIVLKPIYQNLLQQQVGEAALKAANLPVNTKNLQLVSALIEQGLPIDKHTLPQIYRQVLQHPESDLVSLLKMNKLNLPITEENIVQYQQYKNLEYKLLDGMQEMSDEIQKLYDALLGKTESVTVQSLNNQAMMQKANGFIDQMIRIFAEEGKVVDANGQKSFALQSDRMVQENSTSNHVITGKENVAVQQEIILEPALQTGAQNAASTQMQAQKAQEQIFMQQIQPKSVDAVLQLLDQNKLDMRVLYELIQGENPFALSLTAQDKAKIYDSPAFRKLLQTTMQKDWMLTPQEVGEENQVERLYQRLLQTSTRIADVMSDAAQGMAMQPRAAQNLQQNLEFMHQMNQVFQYVQLPIKLSDGQAHGELYVYTNKKHLAQNEGTLTALLHLDMEHLGNMDIHVSLQTQDNRVTTKFFLDEEVIALIEEHLSGLNRRLAEQGYCVKTVVQVREETKTVLEQLEEHVTGTVTPLSYQAFDIRA